LPGPIAAAILNRADASKALEAKIAGESLFIHGVAAAVFSILVQGLTIKRLVGSGGGPSC
jgi:NhaP-type Na+/H+ or K+/H+ antiporter